MSIRGRSLVVTGRSLFGRIEVSAATLAAASGLLTIDLAASDMPDGPWIEIEAGATLSGIRVTRDGDDLTALADAYVTGLFLVSSPAVPYTVTVIHEDVTHAAAYRLWLPSVAVPGTFGNGVLAQHQVSIGWDAGLQRWRVPWLAA